MKPYVSESDDENNQTEINFPNGLRVQQYRNHLLSTIVYHSVDDFYNDLFEAILINRLELTDQNLRNLLYYLNKLEDVVSYENSLIFGTNREFLDRFYRIKDFEQVDSEDEESIQDGSVSLYMEVIYGIVDQILERLVSDENDLWPSLGKDLIQVLFQDPEIQQTLKRALRYFIFGNEEIGTAYTQEQEKRLNIIGGLLANVSSIENWDRDLIPFLGRELDFIINPSSTNKALPSLNLLVPAQLLKTPNNSPIQSEATRVDLPFNSHNPPT